jgi:hypothetical protein
MMGTISDLGIDAMARMLNGVSAPAAFTYMANGSGATAENFTQTQLVSENSLSGSARKAATCTFTSPGTSTWVATWYITGNVTIREFGIFNASSTGTMLYRRVLEANRSLVDGDSIESTVVHIFQRG